MPTAFSSKDLGRVFDGKVLTRGRSLMLFGAVKVALSGDTIRAVVDDKGVRQEALITPNKPAGRVMFAIECSCGAPSCVHAAAGLLGAYDAPSPSSMSANRPAPARSWPPAPS